MIGNLQYYKIFCQVASCGSITKASKLLFITPSAVTKTIKNLEEQLGCQLFTRTPKGVKITNNGQILYDKLKLVFSMIEAAENDLNNEDSSPKGHLYIGMSEMLINMFVQSGFLNSFLDAYSSIKIDIKNLPPAETKRQLGTGELNMAIVCSFKKILGRYGIQREEIGRFENIIVVGARYKEMASSPITADKLMDYNLILRHTIPDVIDTFSQVFIEKGIELNPNITVPKLDTQVELVKAGAGVGIVPEFYVRKEIFDGELFAVKPVDLKLPDGHICIIKDGRFPQETTARIFENMIRQQIAEFLQ